MNIYIYGDKSFKQEMHKILDRSNIKFKFDGTIEDVDSLELLKESIKHSPQDVYLIDSNKIIDKDSLTNKIKFLSPKDGIEKEFLQEHGIGDISFDSTDGLVKHIVKRLEYVSTHNEEVIDSDVEERPFEQNNDESLQDEFGEDVDDIVEIQAKKENLIDAELSDLLEYDESLDEDEDEESEDLEKSISGNDLDIDDEFFNMDLPLDLLSFDESEPIVQEDIQTSSDLDDLDELMSLDNDIMQENKDSSSFEELDELMSLESADLVEEKKKTKDEIKQKTTQGEIMANELDELSNIDENDILSALGDLDFGAPIAPSTKVSQPASSVSERSSSSKSVDTSLSIQSGDLGQLSALIAQLLQNKTLDISIKIRD
ncbi:hypothetical protein [Arcobacter sp. FWKO B]|uniref:hypothetical protein n=1 Tax=Arcobacter sp. FWKO B TaxID=2593672 RepID=UPI0018A38986|nr:hypothetical protein [Arcobacter sp. FWKO B]QOG12383.1 hypothetical protein FWKOB_06580 [Arcobacter sp. FWKO B]